MCWPTCYLANLRASIFPSKSRLELVRWLKGRRFWDLCENAWHPRACTAEPVTAWSLVLGSFPWGPRCRAPFLEPGMCLGELVMVWGLGLSERLLQILKTQVFPPYGAVLISSKATIGLVRNVFVIHSVPLVQHCLIRLLMSVSHCIMLMLTS